jgi:hypothetical protein
MELRQAARGKVIDAVRVETIGSTTGAETVTAGCDLAGI